MQLDNECARKIMAVEHEFELRKQPTYKKRAQLLSQIPDFWGVVFANTKSYGYVSTEDARWLAHIKSVRQSLECRGAKARM
jgi:hypothetical protein